MSKGITTRAMLLVLALALSAPCFSETGHEDEEASERLQSILQAMEPQYNLRKQLLRRSSGHCAMTLVYKTETDLASEMATRIENEFGLPESQLVFQGENIAEIHWQQKDDSLRYDVKIPRNENYSAHQAFLPQDLRIAANNEKGIYYDVREKIAYINDPPTNGANPTSNFRRFEVNELYKFKERDWPERLRTTLERGILPKFTEVVIGGVPCIRMDFSRDKEESADGHRYRWENRWHYVLSPSQGYSVVEATFETTLYDDQALDCRSRDEYIATYAESEEHPGVWLLSRLRHSTSDRRVVDAISVDFHDVRIGVDVPDLAFTFEGLGVPTETLVNDKRLDGLTTRFVYRGGNVTSLDDEAGLLLGTDSEEEPNASNERSVATSTDKRAYLSPESQGGRGLLWMGTLGFLIVVGGLGRMLWVRKKGGDS